LYKREHSIDHRYGELEDKFSEGFDMNSQSRKIIQKGLNADVVRSTISEAVEEAKERIDGNDSL